MTTLHVVPRGDLIDHDTTTADPDCICGPNTEHTPRADGSDGWILIHHALDGRETGEQ